MGIEIKPKFETPPDQTGGVTPSTAEALKMKQDLESAIKEIESAEQYNQYLEVGEKAELEKSKALLKSDVAALDYFLKTGEWKGPVLPAEAIAQPKVPVLTDVEDGWYTFDNTTGEMSEPAIDSGNVISIDDTGVIDQTTGKPVPTNLWFVMKSDSDPSKDMMGVTGKNVGSDIEVTVTYADTHTEVFKIKNGATRRDIQIGVVGLKSDHAVKIDFSQTLIIDKKTGEKSGVYLIGSRYNDKIYGSAGSFDEINGAGGADTLDGMGGSDHVYGYASADVQATYGADELGVDGKDDIYDSFGTSALTDDTIDGGADWDTLHTSNSAGTVSRVEDPQGLGTSNPNDIKSWFSGCIAESTGSELVVTKGVGNEIKIKEAEGYMISGTKDENDLVLNVVKEDKYYKVRVKDYFSTSGTKLNITGGFVDLSGIDVGINSVVLTGTGNSGDVLVGPKTIFDEFAMSVNELELGTSTLNESELNDKLQPFKDNAATEPVWGNATVEKGGITVHAEDLTGTPPELNIHTEFGYSAFIQHNADGSLKITVASNEGFNSDRIVINVVSTPPKDLKDVVVKILGVKTGYVYDLGSTVDAGVTINGGGGTDYTAGYKFGTAFADDKTKIELGFAATSHLASKTSSAKTSDDFATEISNAKDFDALDNKSDGYQKKVDDMTPAGSDEQKTAQKAINTRRAELIHDEITTLNLLQKKIDKIDKAKDPHNFFIAQANYDNEVQKIKDQLEILKKTDTENLYDKALAALTAATEE